MKTPEEVVNDLLTTYAHIERTSDEKITAESLYFLAARAIEADRAQHDLSYAHQIIDRHNARAVIWERGDAEGVLDEMISDGDVEQPTADVYTKIIDRAMGTYYWRSLSDCQEGDWDAIREAIREAL